MFRAAARRRNSLSSDAVGRRRGRGGRPKCRPRGGGSRGLNSKAEVHAEAGVGGWGVPAACAGVTGDACVRRTPTACTPSSSLLLEEWSGGRACTRGLRAAFAPGLASGPAPLPMPWLEASLA